jgi:GT2 family glycosyltransferase
VVNWNGREYLRACLESLARQRDADFEVIVVDNGSTDGSPEMVEREWCTLGAMRVRLTPNSENRGFCAANNQGFAAARGEYVALLNNDAEAGPGFLAALRQVFDRGEQVGMAAAKILVHEDPRRIDKVGHLIYPDGQNRGRGTGELDGGQYDQVEECLWPDGCAAMYRKRMLDRIGGFDEDFFMFGDDAELGLRARIAGWKCLYTPGAVVRHHRGGSLSPASVRRLYLIERNRVLLAVKLFPWSLLCLNPFFYLARLAAGLWAAVRNQGEFTRFPGLAGKCRVALAVIHGDLAALRLAPRMLRKRRQIDALRTLTPRQVRELILRHRIPVRTLAEQSN